MYFTFLSPNIKYKDNDSHAALIRNENNNVNDFKSSAPSNPVTPIQICNRISPTSPEVDVQIMKQHVECPLLHVPPNETTILLLTGFEKYGRTGNNLIEFLHALQYASNNKMVLGIMQDNSWVTRLITDMWMAVQDVNNMTAWAKNMERGFCVKLFDAEEQLIPYREVRRFSSGKDVQFLFEWRHEGSFVELAEFQSHILRTLWRSYNNGTGFNIQRRPVLDMCSVIEAVFGLEKGSVYSVVHSRSLESAAEKIMSYVSAATGCDPVAALEMEPEYVKAILEPLGMLNQPIVFMTDHQRPEILDRLMADLDLGPNILLIPPEASWIGGDITLATMASVFIGNPASTFSGFIAKSRVALGTNNNFLYRKRAENGTWIETCDNHCVFW
jgi:hypothetical protein